LGLAGNRTAVAELSGRNVAYGYDADYLLTLETLTSDPNSGSESYTYDVVGNRKTVSSTIPPLAGSTTSSYDSNDFLTTDTPDANGNTTSSGGVSNTYDFENRMTAHGTTTMVYDGDGNRVSETAGRPRNIWWTRSTPRACRRCRKPEGTPGEINDHGGLFTVRGDEAETRFQGWASGPAVASIKTFGDPGGAAACASDLFARSFGCIDSPESGAPYWGGLLGRVCCWV